MNTQTHYLYKITNLVNGKVYIGVTVNPAARKSQHFCYPSSERLVNKAVSKYGKGSFSFEILCVGSREYIYELEAKAILAFNSMGISGWGYNISAGGDSGSYPNREPVDKRSDDTPRYVSGFWFPSKRSALRALDWGVGKYNSRAKKGTLGEITIEFKRSDDYPTFVAGFWFPNKRVALSSLAISEGTFYKRKKLKTLGSEDLKVKGSAVGQGVYYLGFWFPNISLASDIYRLSPSHMRRCMLQGRYEVDRNVIKPYPKRAYVVHGKSYPDLKIASDDLGIPYNTLRAKFYKQNEGYSYDFSFE